MLGTISVRQWDTVRAAVLAAAERFTALVSSSDPAARATVHWSVADTAAHVASIARMYTKLLRPEENPEPAFPAIVDAFAATRVETVADFNVVTMEQFTERDPAVLLRGMATDLEEVMRVTADQDPARPVDWLGGSRVPLAGVLAHLLNELLIHGWDIARGVRTKWTIPPADAALFFDLFLVGILRYGIGRMLDNDEPPREQRIAVEFRSRYTTPVTFVLHRGRILVEEPGDRDIRITFDPPALNLMLFHRISQARAALTGKVILTGRRPWLLPRFQRTFRLP